MVTAVAAATAVSPTRAAAAARAMPEPGKAPRAVMMAAASSRGPGQVPAGPAGGFEGDDLTGPFPDGQGEQVGNGQHLLTCTCEWEGCMGWVEDGAGEDHEGWVANPGYSCQR